MMDFLGIPALWDGIVAYFTLSPFWLYLAYGAAIIVGAAVLAWLFPVLRSLSGAVIVSVIGMLYAYRRGEADAKAREDARRKREQRNNRQDRPRDSGDWWRW
jgi:CHASE2 domain-containing sensor protein